MKIKLHVLLLLLVVSHTIKSQAVLPPIHGFFQTEMNANGENFLELKGAMTFIGNSVVKFGVNSTSTDNNTAKLAYVDGDSDPNTDNSASATLNMPSCAKVKYAALYWAGMYPFDDFSGGIADIGNQSKAWNQMKFKLPGGSYQTITAGKELLALNHPDYVGTPANRPVKDVYDKNHYVCYKDVTSLLQSQESSAGTANGIYTGADIAVSMEVNKLSNNTGSSGGWNLVVVYEDLDNGLTRYFTIFHGHADLTAAANPTQDINISGFKTIPPQSNGQNVQVKVDLIVSALEGDRSLKGDKFGVLPDGAASVGSNFTWISSTSASTSSNKNFFDSTFTLNNGLATGMVPAPVNNNSVGIDTHMVRLPNANNVNIKNNDTQADFRYFTKKDTYFPYLMAFSAEIVKPILTITNTVHTGGALFGEDNTNANNLLKGNVSGNQVALGDEFYYDVCFTNHSTDGAKNIIIKDELPFGVTLVGGLSTSSGVAPVYIGTLPNTAGIKFDIEFAGGVAFDTSLGNNCASDKLKFLSYTAPTATQGPKIVFLAGDDFGENGNNRLPDCFRLHVKLSDDCDLFQSHCQDETSNTVYAGYIGSENPNAIVDVDGPTNPGSYAGFDICGVSQPTTFLIDRSKCYVDVNTLNGYICAGSNTTISAGTNYATYKWYKRNTDGTYPTSPLTVDANGASLVSTSNTLVVGTPGFYKVEKIAPSGDCRDGQDIFNITLASNAPDPFGDTSPGANDKLRDNKTTCTSDPLAYVSEFYLCGNNSTGSGSKTITLPYTSNTVVKWYKLTNATSAIPSQNSDCASIDLSTITGGPWAWTLVQGDNKTFTMSSPGDYKLEALLDGNCPKDYYFRVFNTNFNPTYDKTGWFCEKDGVLSIKDLTTTDDYEVLLEKEDSTSSTGWTTVSTWAAVTSVPVRLDIPREITSQVFRYQVRRTISSTPGGGGTGTAVDCPFISQPITFNNQPFVVGGSTGSVICNSTTGTPSYTSTIEATFPDMGGTITYEVFEANSGSGAFPGTALTISPTVTSTTSLTFNANPNKKYKVKVISTITKLGKIVVCSDEKEYQFTVPDPITLTLTKQNIGCGDGKVFLTAGGGPTNPTYSYYRVDNSTSPPTEIPIGSVYDVVDDNGVYPRDYTFKLSANGNVCPITKTISVGKDVPFVFKVTPEQANCTTKKGKIEVSLPTPATPLPPYATANKLYQFELVGAVAANSVAYTSPVVSTPSYTFTDVVPDTYTVNVKVTDSNLATYECIYDYPNITIDAVIDMVGGNAAKVNDVGCTSNGSIQFTAPTAGNGDYKYTLTNTTATTSPANQPVVQNAPNGLFANLVAASYEAKITDKNGCTQDFTIVIAPEPTAQTFTVTKKYGCGGEATVTVDQTYVSTYTYTLKDPSTQTILFSTDTALNPTSSTITFSNGIFSNLTVKNYALFVEYGSGCVSVAVPFEIEANKSLTAALVETKGINCFGGSDGEATLTVTNFDATTGYWYEIMNVTPAGVYISASASVVNLTALSNSSNGTLNNVTINVYKTNPSNNGTANSPPTQCLVTTILALNSPSTALTIPDITVPSLSCAASATGATITPNATGGTVLVGASYEYAISSDYNGSNPTTATWSTPAQTFTKTQGNYYIRVTDAKGCIAYSTVINIGQDEVPVFTVSEVACGPDRYGDGADVKVTLGATQDTSVSYEYSIGSPTASSTFSAITFDTTTRVGLITAGSVANNNNATDKNIVSIRKVGSDCIGTKEINIKQQLSFDANTTSAAECKDGIITISNETGGNAPYTYAVWKGDLSSAPTIATTSYTSITAATNQLTVLRAEIAAGTTQNFVVYMKDSENCTFKLETSISKPNPIDVTLEPIYTLCSTTAPQVKVTINDGKAPYSVNVYKSTAPSATTPYATLTITTSGAFATFNGVAGAEYIVKVKDADDCEKNPTITLNAALDQLDAALGDIAQPVCTSGSGSVTITLPTNGTGNYLYTLTKQLVDASGTVTGVDTTAALITATTTAPSTATTTIAIPQDGTYTVIVSEVSITTLTKCPINLGNIVIKTLNHIPSFTPTVTYDCNGVPKISTSLSSDVNLLKFDASGNPTNIKLTYVLGGDYNTSITTALLSDPAVFTVAAGVATYSIKVIYTVDGQTIDANSPCSVLLSVATAVKNFDINQLTVSPVKCVNGNGGVKFEVLNYVSGTTIYYKIGLTGSEQTTTSSPVTLTNVPVGSTIYVAYSSAELTSGTCRRELTPSILTPTSVLAFDSITISPIMCSGSGHADATITPLGKGGWSDYTYEISDDYDPATIGSGTWSSWVAGSTSFSVGVGSYYIKVTDKEGCTLVSGVQVIANPGSPVIELAEVACGPERYGVQADVLVTLTTGDHTQSYEYSVGGGAYTSLTFTTVAPHTATITTGTSVGNNVIEIHNKTTGCSDSESITILENLGFTVNPVNPSSCSTGSFTITNSIGGKPPYEFVVVDTPSTPSIPTTGFATLPTSGSLVVPAFTPINVDKFFDIWIKDSNNCTFKVTKKLKTPENLSVSVVKLDKVCKVDQAKLKITPANGIANYTIQVFDVTDPANPVAVGSPLPTQGYIEVNVDGGKSYNVKVTDSSTIACSETSNTVVIGVGISLDATYTVAQPLCTDDFATITITKPTAGTGPFEYTLTRNPSTVPSNPSTLIKFVETSSDPTVDIVVDIHGTYKLITIDKGAPTTNGGSGCPQASPNVIVIAPLIETLEFDRTKIEYQCDGKIDVKIEPKAGSEAPAGVVYYYILSIDGDPINYTSTDTNIKNTTGVFLIPAGSTTYHVHVVYVKNGQQVNADRCKVFEAQEIKVVSDREFKAIVSSKTPQKCKGDNGTGTATYDVSNFVQIAPNTPKDYYYYRVGVSGTVIKSTSASLTLTGLGLGTTDVYFAYEGDVSAQTLGDCAIMVPVIIVEPLTLLTLNNVTISNVTCTGSVYTDGIITPIARGGTAGYEYFIGTGNATTPDSSTWSSVSATSFTRPVSTINYYIKVVDDGGCEKISGPYVIESPGAPDFDLAEVTDCDLRFGADADVIITNNLPVSTTVVYEYKIGTGIWIACPFTSSIFTIQNGLALGENDVTVRNKNTLCSVTKKITIKPKLSFTVDPINASSCSDGGFNVTTNLGGTSTYKFVIVDASTTGTPADAAFISLDANNNILIPTAIKIGSFGANKDYTIWMMDSSTPNGCKIKLTENLVKDDELLVTFNETHAECAGLDGKIKYTILGGKSSHTVELFIGTVSQGIATTAPASGIGYFNDVPAGTYHILVKDSTSPTKCTVDTGVITINSGSNLNGTAPTATKLTCDVSTSTVVFGAPTNSSSSSPVYVYSLHLPINDSSGNPLPGTSGVGAVVYSSPTTTILTVAAGTYIPVIKDSSLSTGCPQVLPPLVIEPLPTNTLEFLADITYDCDGLPRLVITPKPGSAPSDLNYGVTAYTYTIKGVITNTNIEMVSDANGVADSANAPINGIIPAGDFNYNVYVNYGIAGCFTNVPLQIHIDDNKFKVAYTEKTSVTCFNGSDGTLTFGVANAPTSGFYYSTTATTPRVWVLETSTSHILTALPTGVTKVYVSVDSNGTCERVISEDIKNQPKLEITEVKITKAMECSGSGITPALLDVISQGTVSTRTYTYTIEDSSGIVTPATLPLSISVVGTYTIKIIDNKGCEASKNISITAPDLVDFTLSGTCYDASSQSSIMITMVSVGINPDFRIKIGSGPFAPVNPALIDPANRIYEITNLLPGDYEIKIKDATNCFAVKPITIGKIITFRPETVNQGCGTTPASIKVLNPEGGSGSYEYAFIDVGTTPVSADFTASDTFTHTFPGIALIGASKTYDIYVKSGDCISDKRTVTIRKIDPVNLALTFYDPTCHTQGSIRIDITGGTPKYSIEIFQEDASGNYPTTALHSYSVIGIPASLSSPAKGDHSFFNLVGGNYKIVVKDSSGCVIESFQTLSSPPTIPPMLGVQTANNIACKAWSALTPLEKEQYTLGGYFAELPAGINPDFNTPIDLSPTGPYAGYNMEISIDGGTSWAPGHIVTSVPPYTKYDVIIRLKDSNGYVICDKRLGSGEMPTNVLGLAVDASYSGDCDTGYSVTLDVTEGFGPFEFSILGTSQWFDATLVGTTGTLTDLRSYIFNNLTIGNEYVFLVRDKSNLCIKRNKNVIPFYNNPVPITGVATDICFDDPIAAATGAIDFTITNTTLTGSLVPGLTAIWTLYERTSLNPLGTATIHTGSFVVPTPAYPLVMTLPRIPGLTEGVYYLKLTVNNSTACEYASSNVKIVRNTKVLLNSQTIRDVTCTQDGEVRIFNVSGGIGNYTYEVLPGLNMSSSATLAANSSGVITISNSDITVGSTTAEISIIAIDGNNCRSEIETATINVSVPPIISVPTSTSCIAGNKEINVQVDNHSQSPPPYSYQYSYDNGFTWVGETVSSPNASHTITGIAGTGLYKIRVMDGVGCYSAIVDVDLFDPVVFALKNESGSCTSNSNILKMYGFEGSGKYMWEVISGVGGGIPSPSSGGDIDGSGSIDGTEQQGIISNSQEVYLQVNNNTSYGIRVTDIKTNCSVIHSVLTGEGLKPDFTYIKTMDKKCSDGTVKVVPNTSGLIYTISPSTTATGFVGANHTQVGSEFTFVTTDNTKPVRQDFIITATNADNCYINKTITIEIPAKINIDDVQVTQFGCASANTSSNAKIVVTNSTTNITGGTGPYLRAELYKYDSLGFNIFISSKPVTLPITFDLDHTTYSDGGDFFIRIVDTNECFTDYAVTVDKFDTLEPVDYVALNAKDCNGIEKIKIKVDTANNDPSKVTVTVTDNASTVTSVPSPYITDLNAANGPYTITLTHTDTGCVSTKVHAFSVTPSVTIQAAATPVSCKVLPNGDPGNDGTVSITLNNYSGTDFNYYVFKSTELDNFVGTYAAQGDQSNLTASGLIAGTYKVRVELLSYPFSNLNASPNLCNPVETFTIIEPVDAIVIDTTVTDLNCNTSNDGELSYSATKGWGAPYNYKVEKVTFNSTIATSGAPLSTSMIVNESFTTAITPISNPGQNGGFGTDTSLTNLIPGYYKVSVKDLKSCEVYKYVEIKSPSIITGTIAIDEFSCDDTKTAEVIVTATGGTVNTPSAPGYTYLLYATSDLSTPIKQQTNNVLSVPLAGEYVIKVKDINDCIATLNNFTIHPKFIVDPALETTGITCSSTGIVTVTIPSGSGNYSYSVSNTDDSSEAVQTGVVNGGASSFTFTTSNTKGTNNSAGDGDAIYKILVKDTSTLPLPVCEKEQRITIQPSVKPSFTVTPSVAVCAVSEYQATITSSTNLVYSFTLTASSTQLSGSIVAIDGSTGSLTINKTGTGAVTENVTITATNPITGCSKDEIVSVVMIGEIEAIKAVVTPFSCTTANSSNPAVITLETVSGATALSGGSGAAYRAELWKVDGAIETKINDIVPAVVGTSFQVSNEGVYYIKLFDNTNYCSVSSTPHVTVNEYKQLEPVTVIPVAGTRSCSGEEKVILDWTKVTPTTQVTLKDKNGLAITIPTLIPTPIITPTTTQITVESNLAPYEIIISDTATGCEIVQTYNLSPVPTPGVTVIPTAVTCKGTATGKVGILFTDGYTGAFTFSVTDGSTTYTQTDNGNLAAGSYTGNVVMTGFPNCTVPVTFTIDDVIDDLILTVVPKDVTCTTSVDGQISFSSVGGSGDYKYTVTKYIRATAGTPVDPAVPSTFTSSVILQTNSSNSAFYLLEPATYEIVVFDRNGCNKTELVEINKPDEITANLVVEEKCDGSDAELHINTVAGGTPAPTAIYQYIIYNDDGTIYAAEQNSSDFTIADAGTYNAQVIDANDCTSALMPFTIHEKISLDVNEVVTTTCSAKGKVLFTVNGGTTPFTYTVTGSTFGPLLPADITAISPTEYSFETTLNVSEVYTITVTNAASAGGCTISKDVTIAVPTPDFDVVASVPLCSSDFSILTPDNPNLNYTAISSLGTSNVDISIIDPATGVQSTAVPPVGIITINKKATVLTAVVSETIDVIGTSPITGCTVTKQVDVSFGEDIAVPDVSETQFNCTTGTNTLNIAKIEVTTFASTVNAPYTASLWKVGALNPTEIKTYTANVEFDINDYAGGDYVIKMFDKTNVCTSTSVVVTIDPFVELKAPLIDPVAGTRTCIGNGKEEVNITWFKNSANVVLQIVKGTSTPTTTTYAGVIGSNIETVTLGQGDKIVISNTDSSCELTQVYNISDPQVYKIIISKKDVCFGSGNTNGEATFSFVGTPTYGSTFTYNVYEVTGGVVGTTPVATSTTSSTITGLPAGDYQAQVTMTASPECKATKDFSIVAPVDDIAFIATSTKATDVSCNGVSTGAIEFNATGGWGSFTYDVQKLPIVSNPLLQTNGNTIITGLDSGQYQITAKDRNGCTKVQTLQILDPSAITATLVTASNCNTTAPTKVTVTAAGGFVTGGSTTYKYVLHKEGSGGVYTIYDGPKATNEFDIAAAGTYKVEVLNDKGCSSPFTPPFIVYDKLKFNLVETTSPTCSATGEVTINISSGSGTYTPAVTVGTPAVNVIGITGTGNTFTFPTAFSAVGDAPKEYSVTVTDTNVGTTCDLTKDIIIGSPTGPNFSADEFVSTCFASPYVAIFSNPNFTYTYSTALNANITDGTTVTNASAGVTSIAITGNKLSVSSIDGASDLSGTITVTATDPTTGCTKEMTLTINIPGKVKHTLASTGFNCTALTNDVSKASVTVTLDSSVSYTDFTSASLYKGALGSGVLIANHTVTSAIVAFDIEDQTGGDYYIKLFNGSCVTTTAIEAIAPFAILDPYTLTVTIPTDCNGDETINIALVTGVTITVEDDNGNSVPTTGSGNYPVNVANAPYAVTLSSTDPLIKCQLSGSYIPGPTPTYVIDENITNAYCTGSPAGATPTGSAEFNFATQTPYTGTANYVITNAGILVTTTNPGVSGASGTYTGSNIIVTGLLPGDDYELVVTLIPTSTGCIVKLPFEIKTTLIPLELESIDFVLGCDSKMVSGNMVANMTINVKDQSGAKPYSYHVENTVTSYVYDGYDNYLRDLVAGTYDITVTDLYGCVVTEAITVTEPTPITSVAVVSQQIDCNGNENAIIKVTNPSGGVDNSTKYWAILEYPDGAKTSPKDFDLITGECIFDGLKAANGYNVFVIGEGGCISPAIPLDITDKDKPKIVTELKQIDCTYTQASVEVTITSPATGTNPFEFYMVNPDGTAVLPVITNTTGVHIFDHLDATASGESYTFYGKDKDGCVTDISKVSVSPQVPLEAEVIVINGKLTCFGTNDGMVTVSATGGYGNNQYSLSKGGVVYRPDQSSNEFNSLEPGVYTVKVTSDTGCNYTIPNTFEIVGPDELKIGTPFVVSQKCVAENDGVIEVSPIGGYVAGNGFKVDAISGDLILDVNGNPIHDTPISTGYKYSISSDAFGRVRDSGRFENLAPGTYTITVFDSNGACPKTIDVVIDPAAAVVAILNNQLQDNCDANSLSFEVELSGGTLPYYVDLLDDGNYVQVSGTVNTAGNTVVIFDHTDGLLPGKTYNVSFQDSRRCKPVPVALVFDEVIDLGLEIQPVRYDCSTNESTIIATVDNKYLGEVEYTLWAVDPSGGANIDMLTNATGIFDTTTMPVGEYYIVAKQVAPSTSTCEETSSTVELKKVTENLKFTVDTSQMNTFIVDVIGGLAPYKYSFNGGLTFSTNNTFAYSSANDYEIVVQDARSSDINEGCPASDIVFGDFETIKIPNYFTPDGDGINDYWYPQNVETYHDLRLTIFDRYSREIKDFKGFSIGWDGIYKGKALPEGDYWFKIRFTELSGSVINKVGNFTLYRKED